MNLVNIFDLKDVFWWILRIILFIFSLVVIYIFIKRFFRNNSRGERINLMGKFGYR